MSLRARILLYVVAVMGIVFVLVVATILPGTLHDPHAQKATARDAALTLKSLFERLDAEQRSKLLASDPRFFSEQNALDGWILTERGGRVLYWMHPMERRERLTIEEAAAERFDFNGSLLSPDGDVLQLYAHASRRVAKDGLDWWRVFAVMAVGTGLLAFVVYGLLLRLVVKPLERMAAATRATKVTGGLLLPVAGSERSDEVGELVRAYNTMVAEVNDLRRKLEQRVKQTTHELEATQQQLVMSDRLSMAGRMAAGVAHEVNNPLGGMLNAARSLQSRAAEGSREREYLELILEGLARIQGIMSSLLQFSRPAQQESSVDVADVMEGALIFCRHRCTKSDIEIVHAYETNGGRLNVRGFRSELGQVFLNLLVNAIDALESGNAAPKTLKLSIRRDDGNVIAEVADNGAGMSEDVRKKAGQFFFTTKGKGKGTGLGLAIAQHIIAQHQGTLSIESTSGRGVRVCVTLPAEEQHAALAAADGATRKTGDV
jgi:signal transduction histidine kinase